MTVCTRCGKEIAEQRTNCPSCGTSLFENQVSSEAITDPTLPAQQKTKTFPFDSLYEEYIPQLAPIYERNYAARPLYSIDTSSQKASAGEQEKASTAIPTDSTPGSPAPITFTDRFFHVNTNAPLIVEILLSLFMGIFGAGWLFIGRKRTGTLLLAISLIFYLPLLILSYGLAYFSDGLSILCTGPFTLAAVLLNAFLLHKTMQRK
jgi:predicted  nucleic acid-binding Zn-ribbon protein